MSNSIRSMKSADRFSSFRWFRIDFASLVSERFYEHFT
jgi:hypothetical protein